MALIDADHEPVREHELHGFCFSPCLNVPQRWIWPGSVSWKEPFPCQAAFGIGLCDSDRIKPEWDAVCITVLDQWSCLSTGGETPVSLGLTTHPLLFIYLSSTPKAVPAVWIASEVISIPWILQEFSFSLFMVHVSRVISIDSTNSLTSPIHLSVLPGNMSLFYLSLISQSISNASVVWHTGYMALHTMWTCIPDFFLKPFSFMRRKCRWLDHHQLVPLGQC